MARGFVYGSQTLLWPHVPPTADLLPSTSASPHWREQRHRWTHLSPYVHIRERGVRNNFPEVLNTGTVWMTNGEGGAGATTTKVGPRAWWHGSTKEVSFVLSIFKMSSSYTLPHRGYLDYGANGMSVFITKTFGHGFDYSSTLVRKNVKEKHPQFSMILRFTRFCEEGMRGHIFLGTVIEKHVFTIFVVAAGIPNTRWFGIGDYNVLVMDLLGPTLDDPFIFYNKNISQNCTCAC